MAEDGRSHAPRLVPAPPAIDRPVGDASHLAALDGRPAPGRPGGADPAHPVGAGITPQTLQVHGLADRYALAGAASLASLYSSATASTPYPAATLNRYGAGYAAAFAYDLARSVAYTRQGNPATAGT